MEAVWFFVKRTKVSEDVARNEDRRRENEAEILEAIGQ